MGTRAPAPGRDREIEDALRRDTLAHAPTPVLIFGIVFLLLAVLNGAFLPPPGGIFLGSVNLLTAIALLTMRIVIVRRPVPLSHAHAPHAVVAALALVCSAVSLWLFPEPVRMLGPILVVLVGGIVFGSRALLLASIVGTSTIYLASVAAAGMSIAWVTYGMVTIAVSGAALAFQNMRLRALRSVERYRLDLADRNAALDRALKETVASNARFRTVVSHVHDVILSVDAEARIRFASPASERALGLAPAQLTDRSLLHLVHPEEREHVRAAIAEAGRTEGLALDARLATAEGRWRTFEIRGNTIREEGQSPQIVCAARDVTERLEYEAREAEQRDMLERSARLAALGTLVAGVAHEINNPLTYMRGNAQLMELSIQDLLADPAVPASARATLQEVIDEDRAILHGIDRLAEITAGLKQAAKGSNGARVPTDINRLCREAIAVARPRFHDAIDIDSMLACTKKANVNPTEISQVVLNLVLNAVDAVEATGKGSICLRTYDEDDGIVVEVEDTGVGIAPEDQLKLFTPLHTTKDKGTGLGLSVSYRIVQGHEGRLTFQSAPGAGSTFRVALPSVAK